MLRSTPFRSKFRSKWHVRASLLVSVKIKVGLHRNIRSVFRRISIQLRNFQIFRWPMWGCWDFSRIKTETFTFSYMPSGIYRYEGGNFSSYIHDLSWIRCTCNKYQNFLEQNWKLTRGNCCERIRGRRHIYKNENTVATDRIKLGERNGSRRKWNNVFSTITHAQRIKRSAGER